MATIPVLPMTLRDRFDALSLRERRMLGLLAVALVIFLLYLMLRDGGEDDPVELGDGPAAVVTSPPPPPAFVPPPPVPITAPPVAAAPVPAATAFRLIGIFGGGPGGGAAVLAMPDGSQRTVRVGREFQPGTRLRAVSLRHAIITTPGGDIMLEIGKDGGTAVPAPAATPAGAAAPPRAPAQSPDRARETMQYRLGLEPRRSGDRINGFVVKPGAQLPALQKAGLMPGDVVLAVNGRTFDSAERVEELADEIASSYTAEFEVERGGRRMKFALKVAPRRSR